MNATEYLAVHKVDYPGKNHWYLSDPESFNQSGIDEILESIGTMGTRERRLCISYTFSYLQFPTEKTEKAIKNLLELSVKNNLPVILHLDGVNWWSFRSDLWNFWDISQSGYNPENIINVERYDWDINCAVKLGWRNWGSQIRVVPAPNLASTAFLNAQKNALDRLLPIIAEWYGALPENQKYLFAGIVFGWELSTYVQAYFYEDGNILLNHPSEQDPQGGVENSIALGYAAAKTLGIQHDGIITDKTQDKICSFYMEFLIKTALENSIDPKKIITHSFIGGKTKRGGGQSGMASISDIEGVIPGWSWYDADFKNIDIPLAMIKNRKKLWAAIEVKPWDLSLDIINSLFAYKGCRYVNIYNWENIRNDKDILNIIRNVLYSNAERFSAI